MTLRKSKRTLVKKLINIAEDQEKDIKLLFPRESLAKVIRAFIDAGILGIKKQRQEKAALKIKEDLDE